MLEERVSARDRTDTEGFLGRVKKLWASVCGWMVRRDVWMELEGSDVDESYSVSGWIGEEEKVPCAAAMIIMYV